MSAAADGARRASQALAAGAGSLPRYTFAAALRNHVISRPRVLTWMRSTFAAAFAALGTKLALADR